VEVGFFFADVLVAVANVIISVIPAALTLLVRVTTPLLLLFFKAVPILLPVFTFIVTTMFKILPPIIFALLALVRMFSSLLRALPIEVPSESPRYQHGVNAFFNGLVTNGREVQWDKAYLEVQSVSTQVDSLDDYSHIANPFEDLGDTSRRSAPDWTGRPSNRGSLHKRYRDWRDAELRKRSRYDEHRERARVAESVTARVIDSMHTVVDSAAPAHVHVAMVGNALDHAAVQLLGYRSAWHALEDYNARYGHPAMVVLAHTPDLYNSVLGRMIRGSAQDDDGMSHHEWRRAGYPPVQNHPNGDHINREITRHAREIEERRRKIQTTPVQVNDTGIPQGTVPMPFEMPVLLGSNCYTSKPKFILCLPVPKPRHFKTPDLMVPTNLLTTDMCPGFVPPPSYTDGVSKVFREMFNPITAIRNSWNIVRYLVSASASLLFSLNSITVNNALIGRFFDLFLINSPIDGPITTAELLCIIPYAWYPVWLASAAFLAFVFAVPILWLLWSLIVYTLLPIAQTIRWRNRLMAYYWGTAKTESTYRTRKPLTVAEQRWAREVSVRSEDRGFAAVPRGAVTTRPDEAYELLENTTFSAIGAALGDDAASLPRTTTPEQVVALICAERERNRARRELARRHALVAALIDSAHRMGALSSSVTTPGEARRHMSAFGRAHPIASHAATITHARDVITNVEVNLGHRAQSEAVMLAEWE